MKTLDDIRNDLKEIRYYYSRKTMFDRMGTIVESDVVKTVNHYNSVIRSAPAMLYDIYMSVYIFNNTQEAVADDWDMSFSYVHKVHEKLLQFLQANIKGGSNI